MNTGMAGMKILDTKICKLDHGAKTILYRGYDLKDLAKKAHFEEIICLLLSGDLPNKGELHWYHSFLHANCILPTQPEGIQLNNFLNNIPKKTDIMDILKLAVSFWGI